MKCEIPAPKNPDPSFVYGFVEFAEGADAVVAQKDMSVEKFDGALLRVKVLLNLYESAT